MVRATAALLLLPLRFDAFEEVMIFNVTLVLLFLHINNNKVVTLKKCISCLDMMFVQYSNGYIYIKLFQNCCLGESNSTHLTL